MCLVYWGTLQVVAIRLLAMVGTLTLAEAKEEARAVALPLPDDDA